MLYPLSYGGVSAILSDDGETCAIISAMDKEKLLPLTSPEAIAALSKVKVIYTDLDGTLLAPGGTLLSDNAGNPSLATAEALIALRNAGIDVVPVSGRNRIQMEEITRMIGVEDFVSELGGITSLGRFPNVTLTVDRGVWPDDVHPGSTPVEVARGVGVVGALMEAFPGLIEVHHPWSDDREITVVLRGRVDPTLAAQVLSTIEPAFTLLDNGTIHPPMHTLTVRDDIRAYHLLPTGTDKVTALRRDLERRGLTREETAAIGDSFTDVVMGEATGMLILVANALENARAMEGVAARDDITFHTEGHTTDGWVEFARALLAAQGIEG